MEDLLKGHTIAIYNILHATYTSDLFLNSYVFAIRKSSLVFVIRNTVMGWKPKQKFTFMLKRIV